MDKRANFRLFENFEKLFRAIVSDNHSASVLAYELPLKEFGHLDDNLFIEHDYQKIYLLHDAAHLIKVPRVVN